MSVDIKSQLEAKITRLIKKLKYYQEIEYQTGPFKCYSCDGRVYESPGWCYKCLNDYNP